MLLQNWTKNYSNITKTIIAVCMLVFVVGFTLFTNGPASEASNNTYALKDKK